MNGHHFHVPPANLFICVDLVQVNGSESHNGCSGIAGESSWKRTS